MPIIVMKFGSPASKTTAHIQQIAQKAIEQKKNGYDVIVVTTTMPALRQSLRQYVEEVTSCPNTHEKDIAVATGGQMTSALVAMAIEEQGYEALSLTAWQSGIITDSEYNNARIERVNTSIMQEHIGKGKIIVITGNQGMDESYNVTTLGKGGVETTAVAIAAAMDAERVDIYCMVGGVYTADCSIVHNARKLMDITYDEMLELVNLGAHIIHPRAVELAKKLNVPIMIRSNNVNDIGTMLKEEIEVEKNLIVRGIAYEADIIRLTIGYNSYEEASLAEVFSVLANNQINVDIIVQAVIHNVKPTISFTIAKEDFANALRVLESSKEALGFSFADFEVGLAKVSIIGSGMVKNPGVAATMFDRLRAEHIQVRMVSTSEIKVSVVVPQDDMVRAANALHEQFNLAERVSAF